MIIDSEEDGNIPLHVSEPHYSPSGKRLFYYVKSGDEYISYAMVEAVVRDFIYKKRFVLRIGSIDLNNNNNPVGGFVTWCDDDNVILTATGWVATIKVSDGYETRLRGWPLHIWQSN